MPDPLFVVQHHLATADHYDFRLEIEGVLVSWAIPKGPTLDPSRRRLAVRTDDHDLAHATYEGATGGRGRGIVQVWDRGTFRSTSHRGAEPVDAATALSAGRLSFVLDGAKLRGGFGLVRTRRWSGRDSWLLIKKADEFAVPGVDGPPGDGRSVLSGRTVDEIGSLPR